MFNKYSAGVIPALVRGLQDIILRTHRISLTADNQVVEFLDSHHVFQNLLNASNGALLMGVFKNAFKIVYNRFFTIAGRATKKTFEDWSRRRKSVKFSPQTGKALNQHLPGDDDFIKNQILPQMKSPLRRLFTIILQTQALQGEEFTQEWVRTLHDFTQLKSWRQIEVEMAKRDRLNRLNPLAAEIIGSFADSDGPFAYTDLLKEDIRFGVTLIPSSEIMTFPVLANNFDQKSVPLDRYLEQGHMAVEALESMLVSRDISWSKVANQLSGQFF